MLDTRGGLRKSEKLGSLVCSLGAAGILNTPGCHNLNTLARFHWPKSYSIQRVQLISVVLGSSAVP